MKEWERHTVSIEFRGTESIFYDVIYQRFREIDPNLKRSHFYKMLLHEYIDLISEKKVVNSLIDNIVKDVYQQRVSGKLKEKLEEDNIKYALLDKTERFYEENLTKEQLAAMEQDDLIKKVEKEKDDDNKSNNTLSPDRGFFTEGVREIYEFSSDQEIIN